jgi:ABC-type glutathione transport system ATPase component
LLQAIVSGRVGQLPTLAAPVRRVRGPWLPLGILLVLVVCAAFAAFLAPYDPTLINMLEARLAPGEDWIHPLGTDVLGRDMMSRLIYGARTSALISLGALATGALLGTLVGLVSGYKGGWLDALIMRTVVIQVEGITKHFPVTRGVLLRHVVGVVKAVDGISFQIHQGRTYSRVGESGCGKTTTARMILLIERPRVLDKAYYPTKSTWTSGAPIAWHDMQLRQLRLKHGYRSGRRSVRGQENR